MKKFISKIVPQVILNRLRRYLKNKSFRKKISQMSRLKESDFIDGLEKVGIEAGDTIFVHCSLSNLGFIENGSLDIINAMKKVITSKGNIIIPSFSILQSMEETLKTKTYSFNVLKTKASTGSLPNLFLKTNNVKRSIHPTHSVAVWGKDSDYLINGHYKAETNFGEDTPFKKFLNMNGKILGLGVNYAPITFYHTYEDLNLDKFPDVYLDEKIPALMIDENQNSLMSKFLCHNKKYAENRIEKDYSIEKYFRQVFEGSISKKIAFGDSQIWCMHSKEVIEKLDQLYIQGITIYKIQ